MAWSASKVFAYSVLDVGNNNVKYGTDAYKIALYSSNTITPDNTVTTAALSEYNGAASQWVTGGEVSGTGYSAGGVALSSPSWGQSTSYVSFTCATAPSWSSATFTAYGSLVYDTTNSSKGLCYLYFGGSQSVTSGTFTVSFATANSIANCIAQFSC
jgi:hypothetical protein